MTDGALAGLRVVELSRFAAAPYCGKFLVGCGAEVIKVEPPDGDPIRHLGPFKDDLPNRETGATFLFLNTGKKSVTLDAGTPSGRPILLDLIAKADVLLTDWEPALLEQHGLTYEALEKINPRLVFTAISFFGQTGPYRDYAATELIGQAMGGYLSITGQPDGPPVKVCGNVGQYQGGLQGAVGTMAAILEQDLTGVGQLVDVSITESLAFESTSVTRWLNSGSVMPRGGNRLARSNVNGLYPATVLPCKEGWVHVHEGHGRSEMLALLMEEPRIMDPEIQSEPYGHADLLDQLCLPWLSQHDKFEAVTRAQELRLPFAEVLDIPEVLLDEQHAARDYIVELDHPVAGVTGQPGFVFQSSETPWQTSRAPLLGEHCAELYGELLGFTADELRALRERKVI